MIKYCQMTVSHPAFPGAGWDNYNKCNRVAKFRVPKIQMGVEYVCGIHARVLDRMYKRTDQKLKCEPSNSTEPKAIELVGRYRRIRK